MDEKVCDVCHMAVPETRERHTWCESLRVVLGAKGFCSKCRKRKDEYVVMVKDGGVRVLCLLCLTGVIVFHDKLK